MKTPTASSPRKIIHIDMDAFYASVEQRDFPELRGKPLVVGGDPNGRGVVAAASYEVRQFGVRSAMSCYEARKRCPEVIFVRPRFEVYRAVSSDIRNIMYSLTPHIEPLSLDEAYLDVTGLTVHKGSATLMANWLRAQILQHTGLTASAGVSFNKMLAKTASDINKPNGTAIITPEDADAFISTLPIERFHGIGKATARRLHAMGVTNGADLRRMSAEVLINEFGKRGQFYHDIAHGRDERAVKSERLHKSVGSETTFRENLNDDTALRIQIYEQNADAFSQLHKKNLIAHTITLKVKYADFTQITRTHTLTTAFSSAESAHYWLDKLFLDIPRQLPIRLVGVTFSSLTPAAQLLPQLNLFE
ncbi:MULTISPECIES: DNA polymerase IV [unclassified Psychrobacter]|uniref:DNA polymerase IV n=1 Tax=unclassified Psychrobacter TaxID=196806 RepID=UPI00086B3AE7|nr:MULTISPECIES: DNA polymerase IV [unclassified Psychrobacter]OEH69095.1 MAG: DNA polymerase IV [Psychrobacter sp. B29-1]PKG65154.1 DNA polymerase IV [Psychrobacter sp. Choline-02u-13]PKH54652.1 DNA polymerase IV [Psychrobacter sp. Choline-02u-9]TEW86685.1 DNA polymerase IV [Psychrobacter sp. 230]|tara:strand:- start:27582 stop:28667 length:1086 start_codon:yes stop_codon:yes gene_type:complete